MAKIYTLSARNFQSWREFNLPMTGFTVIIGPSDRGKSAIIRSLRGILRNQVGANHITYGEKEVSVKLSSIDGDVKLSRNAKTTAYTVNDEEYSKLAGAVPPIVEAMKFNEVEVNGVKLDPIFAGQFDSQFMLDLSPAELNSIFGLFSSTEKLNSGKKNAASKNLEFNATAKFLASEIQEAEAKSGLLETLNDEMEQQSQEIFKLEDSYNSALTSLNLLDLLNAGQKRKRLLKKAVGFPLPFTEVLVNTLNSGRKLVQYTRRKQNLETIKKAALIDIPFGKILEQQFLIITKLIKTKKLIQRVAAYKQLPMDPIQNELNPLFSLVSKLTTFSKLNKSVINRKLELDLSIKQITEITKQLDDLQGKSIQCPKCGHFFTGVTHGHE